jgi:hypothetical protein
MNRRFFVGITSAMIFTGLAGGMLGPRRLANLYYRVTKPTIERKAAIIRACFPHLMIADGVADRFVIEFMEQTGQGTGFPLKRETLKRFLLSTDFVQKEGEGLIQYVALYSPWRAACVNPFMLVQRQ